MAISPTYRSSETFTTSSSPVALKSTEDLRMWLRQAFPANPIASSASGSTEKIVETYGQKQLGSSPPFSLKSASSRTSLASRAICRWCSLTCEEWVTAFLAVPLLAPPVWAQEISESGSGYVPTFTATSYGTNRGGSAGRVGKPRKSLSGLLGGPVSLDWIDWMAGNPIGWTDLEPLGMDKFQQWLELHGG